MCVIIIKRKCYVSGRCPDAVNVVNIGPVNVAYVISGYLLEGLKVIKIDYLLNVQFQINKHHLNSARQWCQCVYIDLLSDLVTDIMYVCESLRMLKLGISLLCFYFYLLYAMLQCSLISPIMLNIMLM